MILRRLRCPHSSPPCPLTIFVSNISTSQSHASLPRFPSRHQEEASRSVKVFVWWDFENCAVPVGVNVVKVANMIAAAVRTNGIRGPLKIMAFGDVCRLSKNTLEAFSHTGIDLSHVPQGGKNSADTSIIINLMSWVSQNPPPAHLFLISGDKDFAGVLHQLRMKNYNVLLASPGYASIALCSAASIMWQWKSLVNGEDLKGKHFNQPPDGPYGSWYGHDMVALEDPFSIEQPVCLKAEESSKVGLNLKSRPIPEAITKQIQKIMSANPKGLSITDLRSELSKRNVSIDKNFYGHRKFSCFVASMRQILRLRHGADGQIYVRRVIRRPLEPSKCSASIVSEHDRITGDEDIVVYLKLSGGDVPILGAAAGISDEDIVAHSKPACKPCSEVTEDTTQAELQLTPPRQPLDLSPGIHKDVESASKNLCEICQHSRLEAVSAPEASFSRRLMQIFYGCSDGSTDNKRQDFPEQSDNSVSCSTRCPSTLEKSDSSTLTHNLWLCEHVGEVPEFSARGNSTVKDEKSASEGDPKSGQREGVLRWIINWFGFRGSVQESVAGRDNPSERPNPIECNPRDHEDFTKDSFWDEVKTFINSSRGSVLVSQSRTRDEMAENLMKEGPLVLKSLSKTYVMHLVELLISGKKWVEEGPSVMPHFRVVRIGEKSFSAGSSTTNALRSIFLESQSKGNLQKEHMGEKKFQVVPHSGVPASVSNNKSSCRSRSEILSDSQKLVRRVLKQHPEGYNIRFFGQLFLDTYGYPLDYKMLGFKKLVSLLKLSPSAKVQSRYLFPASMAGADTFSMKTARMNSQGEEMCCTTGNSDGESSMRRKNTSNISFHVGDDANRTSEPSLSDDEISHPEASLLGPGPDSLFGRNEGDSGKQRMANYQVNY